MGSSSKVSSMRMSDIKKHGSWFGSNVMKNVKVDHFTKTLSKMQITELLLQ